MLLAKGIGGGLQTMATFMCCGARLPGYVLFAAAFFPTNAQNVVFGLYLIGIVGASLAAAVIAMRRHGRKAGR